MTIMIRILFGFIGSICILFPGQIVFILPYIVGVFMILTGLYGIYRFWTQRQRMSGAFAHGFVLLIVGFTFLVQGKSALVPMGIIWAVLGLGKAADCFIDFLEVHCTRWNRIFALGEFLLRLALSLILLFDPYGKFTPHLAILGIALLLNAIFPERRLNRIR